jgi:hypothetical protein
MDETTPSSPETTIENPALVSTEPGDAEPCRIKIKLSPQVILTSDQHEECFVITHSVYEKNHLVSSHPVAHTRDKNQAESIVHELAERLTGEKTTPSMNAFMAIVNIDEPPYSGKKMSVHTQQLGMIMNGPVEKIAEFGFTSVPLGVFSSPQNV